MTFTYQTQLGGDELRLLEPISITRHALKFRISSFRRSAAPPYTAVSYTWGDDEASEEIYLNGSVFPVRPNLWSCLYYLAQQWDYLWVDAVCIDQTNTAERTTQVRYMGQTYRDAQNVSVWLGLPHLPDWLAPLPPQYPIRTVEVDELDWRDSIVDLANRPYWSRFWVIQEFLLARNVEIHCGNNRLNWDGFKEILCSEAEVSPYSVSFESPNRTNSPYQALQLVLGRHVDKHPEIPQPLHNLVIEHHRAQAKDPRDRVFALLELIHPDEKTHIGAFFPDYSLTEEHVRIITLAHVTQFPDWGGPWVITPDSDEFFSGIGVESKAERKRLLRLAERIDYIGLESSDQVRLVLDDLDEEIDNIDLESSGQAHPVWDDLGEDELWRGVSIHDDVEVGIGRGGATERRVTNFKKCLCTYVTVVLAYVGWRILWQVLSSRMSKS